MVKRRRRAAPSTDEEVLSELALDYPLPKVLLETRTLSSRRAPTPTSCRAWLMRTGRVPPASQARSFTGRPRQLRTKPAEHPGAPPRDDASAPLSSRRRDQRIVSADYSQIELRIMAHLSKTRACSKPSPTARTHRATAAEIFGVTPLEVGPTSAASPRSSTSASSTA